MSEGAHSPKGEPSVRSFRTILTDSGRATSSHPYENGDCSVRSIANVTGLSYDEAWDELRGAGREPLEGFEWEQWARKVGFIQAPWTGQPTWIFRHISLPARKGFPRIKPRDLPSLFPHGAFKVLNPSRVIFGAWECRRVAKDQRLYMTFKCYVLEGVLYRSAVGPVPARSLEEAYKVAEAWYGWKISGSHSDMLVERI